MGDALMTCNSMLVALFQKRYSSSKKSIPRQCSCICHSRRKNKYSSDFTKVNESRFFTCKCSGNCINMKAHCNNCGTKFKYAKPFNSSKKSVKYLNKHTGTKIVLSRHKKGSHISCSCDAVKSKISVCELLHNNKRSGSICCPEHLNDFIILQSWHNTNIQSMETASNNSEVVLENVADIITSTTTTIRSGLPRNNTENKRPKSFYEWEIPFENIEIGEVESTTTKGPVYRGRWHGDVMIYTRSHKTQEEITNFHEEVALLGLIRHENVVLFMGACIHPPHLAVVTSVRKGQTLFTHIHVRQSSFHFGSKFSIAKQIAQGMGYLHAKGIILGKLCSRSIFLESKVKIGITDYTMVNTPVVKNDYGCIPQGYLTYICPELMRTIKNSGLYLSWNEKTSQKADVFAYGTLLYEIFLECYPLRCIKPETLIWKVGNGHTQVLNDGDFPLIFKGIIQSCWAYYEAERSEFHDILSSIRKLNIPRSLQKKLSLSDSGAINEQQMTSMLHLKTSPHQASKWKNS